MKNVFVLGVAAALATTACNKGDAKSDSPAGSSSAASAGGGAAPGAALGPASIEVTWSGKWDPTDKAGDEHPLMHVVNKDTKRPLTYYEGFFYFYDKDKKQLGREWRNRYQLSIPAGKSEEVSAGPSRSTHPKGTEHIEFVVSGANFGSETDKFRVATPPPEQRPMGG